MDFFRRFTFLVCTPGFHADDLEGQRLLEIVGAVERMGFQVIKARRIEDAEIAVQDRCRDRLHGRRLGQEGPGGQDGGADRPDAQARPRHADRDAGAPQALRGHPGRSHGLHRRLRLPRGGNAGLHRPQPRQPAQAICRDVEDAVLRRARRLCGGRQPALDLPRPQRRHFLQSQPDRPHLRRASRRSGVSRRPRQFRAGARRPPHPRGPGAARAERRRRRSSGRRRPISC